MSPPLQAEALVAVGFESDLITSDDTRYAAITEGYFDNGAKLHPASYFQPRTSSQVAIALKALADAGQAFAVRSGGATNRIGSSNIDGGITFDLSLLNGVSFESETGIAKVGPGAIWYVDSC